RRAPRVIPVRVVTARGEQLGLLGTVILLDVREEEAGPADLVAELFLPTGRQRFLRVVVVVHGQADLLEVVGAAHAGGGLAHLLDGGDEEPDQNGDDRNHHQQLDQRERTPAGRLAWHGKPSRTMDERCLPPTCTWYWGGGNTSSVERRGL